MKPYLKRSFLVGLALVAGMAGGEARFCHAQTSGNIGYSRESAQGRAEQHEQEKRGVAPWQTSLNVNDVFIEANVLMNVKADEFVAVFGVSEEAETIAGSHKKMDATIKTFTAALARLGLSGASVDVDFVSQNKIYGYEVTGTVAKEKLTGFDLKKNVSIRYKNKAMLNNIVVAASEANVFDLIKVDYIVTNTARVKKRLRDEAVRVVKEKVAEYDASLGVKLVTPPQIQADKTSVYYPSGLYDAYVASEGEGIDRGFDRSRFVVQTARKTRTFFFNPLGEDGFDTVFNPVVVEPVVQFTHYLRVRYETKKMDGAKEKTR